MRNPALAGGNRSMLPDTLHPAIVTGRSGGELVCRYGAANAYLEKRGSVEQAPAGPVAEPYAH